MLNKSNSGPLTGYSPENKRSLPEFNLANSIQMIQKLTDECNILTNKAVVTVWGDLATNDCCSPSANVGGLEHTLFNITEDLDRLRRNLVDLNDHIGIE